MRIRSIDWVNYRHIPDGRVGVRGHLVLVGPNDSGKSSIVRAIHLCLGVPPVELQRSVSDADLTDPALPLVLTVTLAGLDDEDREVFRDETSTRSPEALVIAVAATLETGGRGAMRVRRYFPEALHERAPTERQLDAIGFRLHLGCAVEPEPVDGRGATIVSAAQHEQRQLPLVDQSDGIKALSVLKLLEASPPAVRIIAIDEPETHLHPAAQRSVAKMLRASDRQHVLVTHSPSIVGAMDPMDIVAFRADRQARQLAKGAPIADHDATVRYWSDRLIEPLTARRVALVEGVSDRILVERVAELIGIDLDKLGVVLFELGGASLFPMVYRVLGPPGFDLPLTGLVDEDARASWAETVRVRPAGLEATGFIVSDPDLEGVYIDRLGVAVVSTMLLASPLINEQSLLAASKATTVAEITRERLWTYCRNKRHKIAAALAVAGAIDQAQALALEPLIRFLRLLT